MWAFTHSFMYEAVCNDAVCLVIIHVWDPQKLKHKLRNTQLEKSFKIYSTFSNSYIINLLISNDILYIILAKLFESYWYHKDHSIFYISNRFLKMFKNKRNYSMAISAPNVKSSCSVHIKYFYCFILSPPFIQPFIIIIITIIFIVTEHTDNMLMMTVLQQTL